ncbi:MAG: hypothetical protein ACSW8A_05125, partial [Lachnospiraceae bacterium]
MSTIAGPDRHRKAPGTARLIKLLIPSKNILRFSNSKSDISDQTFDDIAEIKCGKIILDRLRPADHL